MEQPLNTNSWRNACACRVVVRRAGRLRDAGRGQYGNRAAGAGSGTARGRTSAGADGARKTGRSAAGSGTRTWPGTGRHARRRPVGFSRRPRRTHPRLGRHQGSRSPVGHRVPPRWRHARDRAPRTAAPDQERCARPDADRPDAGDARDRPRWSARRLAPSALRAEPADLSRLLEAGPEGSRRCDDGGDAREVGWRIDAHRGQGHPRRRCLSRWNGIAAGTRSGERQLRLAARVGQRRIPLRLARRSQLSAGVAEPGVAHRQDSAHP